MNLLKWAYIVLSATPKERKRVVSALMESVKTFHKGEETPQGIEAYNFIKSDKVELVGLAPEMNYIKVDHSNDEFLEVHWSHPTGPTLMFHVKNTPFILLVNPLVEYNKSKLNEIEDNKEIAHLLKAKTMLHG